MPDLSPDRRLRIMHVLRAPLGGLFRHVIDLTRAQVERGHLVGLIADSTTGGTRADRVLAELARHMALGVSRLPMNRNPGLRDLPATIRITKRLAAAAPDVVHGHGSKGGFYARMPGLLPGAGGSNRPVRVYTPHGGSFNYKPGSAVHRIYMGAERMLSRATDIFLFESSYIAGRHRAYVGETGRLSRVCLNGISPAEFIPVRPDPGAADFLYIGELRSAKGIDTLLDALALAAQRLGRAPRLVLVGSGPDEAILTAQAARLGLAESIEFKGPMLARDAFRLGRVMVVPSRAESLPYVVLEAAGARVPLVSTNVGGIPEIFGPHGGSLIAPNQPGVLAARMADALGEDPQTSEETSARLAEFVSARFTIETMTDAVLDGYRTALAARNGAATLRPGSEPGLAKLSENIQ